MAILAQQSRSTGNRNSAKSSSSVSARTISALPAAPRASAPGNGPRSEESVSRDRPVYVRHAANPKSSGEPRRPDSARKGTAADQAGRQNKPEAEILFQKYFKSVGPRTYASQLKRAGNGNHFLVLTEAKRDEKTNEVRKTRLYLFSEDFVPFFRMLHETAQFIRQNPVPDEIRKRQERRWSKKPAGKSSPRS